MPRLVLYNIAYGQGISGKKLDYLKFWKRLFPPKNALTNIVTALTQFRPDIITLIELDKGNLRVTNQLGAAQKRMNLSFSDSQVKYNGKGLTLPLPYIPILKRQSNGLASSYKIVHQQTHSFSRGFKRIVCQYTLQIENRLCFLLVVHLALGKKARKKQLQELTKLCQTIKGPLIVAGDFNASKKEMTQLINSNNLTSAVIGNTFPAHSPQKQLDYILTSPQINITKAKVISNIPYSDHLPLFIEFDVLR